MFVYKHLHNALHSSCFQTVNKYPDSMWFRSDSSEGGCMDCLTKSSCPPAQQDTLLSSGILLKYQILALRVSLLPCESTKDVSWIGYETTRRLLTVLRSVEGTVQIRNRCNHLHYLVLESFQCFTGNLLIPWSQCLGHVELLNIKFLLFLFIFFLYTYLT